MNDNDYDHHDYDNLKFRGVLSFERLSTRPTTTLHLLCPPTLLNRKGEKFMRSGHMFLRELETKKELISASESRQGLLPRNHLNHLEDSVIGKIRQFDFFSINPVLFPAAKCPSRPFISAP